MTQSTVSFKYRDYRVGFELKVTEKCDHVLSKYLNSSMTGLTRERKKLANPNQSRCVRHLLRSLVYKKMNLDIDQIIQEELERLEDQETQVSNDSGAEKASV